MESYPVTLIDRFACTIGALCRSIYKPHPEVSLALIGLIWGRLKRLEARFASMAARFRDGTLRPWRPRAARPPDSSRSATGEAAASGGEAVADDPSRPKLPRVPRQYAWMLRISREAASFGSQLRYMMSDPEMVALLAAAPGLARSLRPLCWALAVDPAEIPALARPCREALPAEPERRRRSDGPRHSDRAHPDPGHSNPGAPRVVRREAGARALEATVRDPQIPKTP